jgi:chromosome segregation ATPase
MDSSRIRSTGRPVQGTSVEPTTSRLSTPAASGSRPETQGLRTRPAVTGGPPPKTADLAQLIRQAQLQVRQGQANLAQIKQRQAHQAVQAREARLAQLERQPPSTLVLNKDNPASVKAFTDAAMDRMLKVGEAIADMAEQIQYLQERIEHNPENSESIQSNIDQLILKKADAQRVHAGIRDAIDLAEPLSPEAKKMVQIGEEIAAKAEEKYLSITPTKP